jgi:hypothetical protein
MKIDRSIVGLLGIAGLAFAAGHFGAPATGASGAWAQAEQEVPPEWQAYIDAGTPGKHHQRLDQLVGDWQGEYRIRTGPDERPLVSHGTVTREWVLGGRYLKEVVEADAPASDTGPYRGLGFIGYNNVDGRYQMIWMDNMSTPIMTATGTYHPDQKILYNRSADRDPLTKRVVHTWGKLHLTAPDRHTYVSYRTDADGRTYIAFEAIMERKK